MRQEETMIQIVVLLTIKDIDKFDDYGTKAVQIMAEHSGKLVSASKLDENESSDSDVHEVHILEFPSIELFHAYKGSQKIQSLSSLREQAIEKTSIYLSNEFRHYG